MKIIKPTTHLVDIGNLDTVLRLPMIGRVRNGMKIVCDRCGKSITDDFFIGGFKKGFPNMKFHENCVDTTGARIIDHATPVEIAELKAEPFGGQ